MSEKRNRGLLSSEGRTLKNIKICDFPIVIANWSSHSPHHCNTLPRWRCQVHKGVCLFRELMSRSMMGTMLYTLLLVTLCLPLLYGKLRHDGMVEVFQLLKGCGFQPTAILDVGANVGAWTNEMKNLFPAASFFMVEGNDQHRGALERIGAPFVITLVGKTPGNLTYYRRKDTTGTGNSVFKENTQFFDDKSYDAVALPVRTLDGIVKHAGPFQLLKIDVQGAEVDALLGAVNTMTSVDVVYTECSLQNYNQGAPSFLDLYVLLDHYGFAFFTVANHFYKDGLCLQFDAFFVRKNSTIWGQQCTHFPRPAYFNISKPFIKGLLL